MTGDLSGFRDAVAAAGIKPPKEIVADGKIHRFASNGNRNDDSGWYLLFDDGLPAGVFGDWRSGLKQSWCSRRDQDMSPQDRTLHRRRMEDAKRQREDEPQRQRSEEDGHGRVVAALQLHLHVAAKSGLFKERGHQDHHGEQGQYGGRR